MFLYIYRFFTIFNETVLVEQMMNNFHRTIVKDIDECRKNN